MVAQSTDFTYHVGDTLPGIPLRFLRDGLPIDLTGATANFYLRKDDASANAISGSATVAIPSSSGVVLCQIITASLGSAGFPIPGVYYGQAEVVWSNGRETARRNFTVQVDKTFREM